MLTGITAALPMALLGAMGYAFIASFGCFLVAKTLTDSQLVSTVAQVLPAVVVATVFTTTGTLAFWVVCFTPFIAGFIIAVIQGIFNHTIASPLAKRGYLGNMKKWAHEIDPEPEFNAAIHLLGEKRVNEVADVSADAEDFHDNIIRAAGLEDHELPEDF